METKQPTLWICYYTIPHDIEEVFGQDKTEVEIVWCTRMPKYQEIVAAFPDLQKMEDEGLLSEENMEIRSCAFPPLIE